MVVLEPSVTLRDATAEDAGLLFAWANDPETRRQSFTTEPIGWDTHVAWLERVLADPNRDLWIGVLDDGTPVGQVRLDYEDDRAEISYSVAPAHRGKRVSIPMVRAACRRSNVPVVAEIKAGNEPSLRLCRAAGFVVVEDGDPVVMRYDGAAGLACGE